MATASFREKCWGQLTSCSVPKHPRPLSGERCQWTDCGSRFSFKEKTPSRLGPLGDEWPLARTRRPGRPHPPVRSHWESRSRWGPPAAPSSGPCHTQLSAIAAEHPPCPAGHPYQLQLGVCNDEAPSRRGEAARRERPSPRAPPEPPSEELLLTERHPARLPAACASVLNIDRRSGGRAVQQTRPPQNSTAPEWPGRKPAAAPLT